MGGQQKPNWDEMVDYAIHSGNGQKISRQKIKAFITENWSISFDSDTQKEHLKDALNGRVDKGFVQKDGGSFLFTQKGAQHYNETYESSEEVEEEGEAAPSSSPKVAAAGTKKKK
ncbi:hypothetical protein JCM11251_001713 [Rhodosporidiobolus azoricus]